jgi:hypothetical protein
MKPRWVLATCESIRSRKDHDTASDDIVGVACTGINSKPSPVVKFELVPPLLETDRLTKTHRVGSNRKEAFPFNNQSIPIIQGTIGGRLYIESFIFNETYSATYRRRDKRQ